MATKNESAADEHLNNVYRKGNNKPKYTYKHFKQIAPDCGSRPDSQCTVVVIKYPVFNNIPSLNDSIKHRFFHLFRSDSTSTTDTNFTKYANKFINSYESDRISDPVRPWKIAGTAEVLRRDSSLITIYFSDDSYDGGAHEHDGFSFINWDSKTSRVIELDDLFIDGYYDKLIKIAEKIFRKHEKLSDNASFENYLFKNGKFGLNNNFLITPNYIIFLYNEYEIKPYTEGTTEIDIPYTQIKSLLRPNTVVAQYTK